MTKVPQELAPPLLAMGAMQQRHQLVALRRLLSILLVVAALTRGVISPEPTAANSRTCPVLT